MMKNKHSAFTLIELIVSIAVVAILAAGLFAVGNYIDTQMKIKRTQATIQLLLTALEQYYNDKYDLRPDSSPQFPDPNNNGINYFRAGCDNDANSIEKLYYRLSLFPEVRKIMDQLPPKSLKDSDKDKNPEIVDVWNQNFRYKYENGWNFPEIISAGPDKKFRINDANSTDDISSKRM
ncbi:MAG: type II secretion system protein [Phycisphaerales bacterium]